MDPTQDQSSQNQPQPDAPAQPASPNQPAFASSESTVFEQPPQTSEPAASVYAQPVDTTQPATAPLQPVITPATTSKGLSTAALVVGILGFIAGPFGILLGISAVIMGAISLKKHQGGRGMSIAGIILGSLVIAITIIVIIFYILLGAGLSILAPSDTNTSKPAQVTTSNYDNAYKIAVVAQAYNTDHISAEDSFAYHYPTYDQLVAQPSLDEALKAKLHSGNSKSVTKEKPIAYESCSEGATFYYFAGIRGTKSFPIGSPEKC